jgi:AraC-like DNA-binding protein
MDKPKTKKGYSYKEIIASDELKPILDKIWVFETAVSTGSDKHFHLTTDFTTTLVFIFPPNLRKTSILLSGPNSQNIPFENAPDLVTIGCRFHPLAVQELFGFSPELTINKAINLSEVLPGTLFKKLRSGITKEKLLQGRIRVINEHLSGLLKTNSFPEEDVIKLMIRKILENKGNTKLEDLYSELTISQRQFQRNFIKRTGLSPKEFCRIVRFSNVTRKLMKKNFQHFDVLVESGYYDQSHYYREFKEFTGMLPAKYVSRQKRIKLEKLI